MTSELSALEAGRQQAVLSNASLWLRYLGLGGMLSLAEMIHHLAGHGDWPRVEHDTLAQALDEAFMDLGRVNPAAGAGGD